MSYGIPQGSIPGPHLFLVYKKYMHSATYLHFIHHVDDSTVITRGDSTSELTKFFNHELCKVFKWLCVNQLCLQMGKSCSTVFTNEHIKALPVHKKNNINLSFSVKLNFFKIIDNKLLFAKYVSNLCSKIFHIFGLLNKFKCFLSLPIKKYYNIVHPHIIY